MRNITKGLSLCLLLLLTGCTPTDAAGIAQTPPDIPAETTVRETADAPADTAAPETALPAAETTAATATAIAEETTEATHPEEAAPEPDPPAPEAHPAPEEAAAEEAAPDIPPQEETYEQFFGVLIDEDCSDFEDPPLHDLPCMLMDSCRASGYGLDVQQPDGSWQFYPFDETGQELSWDYLLHTDRMDGLYVRVTGTWEGDYIKVIAIEEI